MLVLSRRLDESIVIDGGITLKVIGIQGGRVRIGIEAPRSVGIERAEIAARRMEDETKDMPRRTAPVSS